MHDCESYEALSSALVDDQLEHREILEIVDHLVRCPSCRRFYAGARSLDGLLGVTGLGRSRLEAPRGVWERLSGRPPAATDPPLPGALSGWLLPLAATVALLIGIGFTVPEPSPVASDRVAGATSTAEAMDEERFVALTTELLRADRRYHQAMLEVMEKVEEADGGHEASGEGAVLRTEDDEARSRV